MSVILTRPEEELLTRIAAEPGGRVVDELIVHQQEVDELVKKGLALTYDKQAAFRPGLEASASNAIESAKSALSRGHLAEASAYVRTALESQAASKEQWVCILTTRGALVAHNLDKATLIVDDSEPELDVDVDGEHEDLFAQA